MDNIYFRVIILHFSHIMRKILKGRVLHGER